MKKLLLVLLMSVAFTAQAAEKSHEGKVMELATKLFLEAASHEDFDWTDYSCEELMHESMEAARNTIDKVNKKDGLVKPKMKKG